HRKFFEQVFFQELSKRDIRTVIHLGDLFDKSRSINTKVLHETNSFFFSKLKHLDMYVIPGNHDSYFRDSLSVTTVSEVLGNFDNVYVYDSPEVEKIGNTSFAFVPWGINEFPEADVLCAHLELIGFEMYNGVKNLDKGLSSIDFAKKYKKVLSGHYHHPSSKGNINYIGAPIEITWSDYGGPRGFQILDTESMSLTHIKNPHRMFRKISYDDTDKTLEQILTGKFSI